VLAGAVAAEDWPTLAWAVVVVGAASRPSRADGRDVGGEAASAPGPVIAAEPAGRPAVVVSDGADGLAVVEGAAVEGVVVEGAVVEGAGVEGASAAGGVTGRRVADPAGTAIASVEATGEPAGTSDWSLSAVDAPSGSVACPRAPGVPPATRPTAAGAMSATTPGATGEPVSTTGVAPAGGPPAGWDESGPSADGGTDPGTPACAAVAGVAGVAGAPGVVGVVVDGAPDGGVDDGPFVGDDSPE
jgi:hypothetical protein